LPLPGRLADGLEKVVPIHGVCLPILTLSAM
jgi:hypothetical protein